MLAEEFIAERYKGGLEECRNFYAVYYGVQKKLLLAMCGRKQELFDVSGPKQVAKQGKLDHKPNMYDSKRPVSIVYFIKCFSYLYHCPFIHTI